MTFPLRSLFFHFDRSQSERAVPLPRGSFPFPVTRKISFPHGVVVVCFTHAPSFPLDYRPQRSLQSVLGPNLPAWVGAIEAGMQALPAAPFGGIPYYGEDFRCFSLTQYEDSGLVVVWPDDMQGSSLL